MVNQIRIVLCHTTHPGNIGAAARAMKTMGLTELVLVKPRYFPHADATARASGADDVLSQARVVDDLAEAIGDCQLVLGTSARLRSISLPQFGAREAARKAVEVADQEHVALLFGQERSGLTNEEMASCHALVHVPVNPDYGSLNLGAAVQILSYEVRMARVELGQLMVPEMATHVAAPQAMLEGFIEHLETVLRQIEFLDPNQSKTMMQRLRRLFQRAAPEQHEIHILRGILSAIQKTVNGTRKSAKS